MPANSRKFKRPRRNGPQGNQSVNMVRELKAINEKLSSTQLSQDPETRDVLPVRIKRDKVYSFVQSIETAITGNGATEVDGTLFYTLNLFGNLTPLTTLFDTYRFVSIETTWIPTDTSPDSSSPVYTATDFDDAISTPIATLLNYDTLKVAPSGVVFKRTFNPAMALAAYGGAFTSYAQRKMQWCDCASPGVQWFGLKYGIAPSGSATAPNWQVTSRCVIQFKNPR